MKFLPLAAMLLCPMLATAQLAVSISPPKVVGQKAVVQLTMKNDLSDAVESARAVCFLLDGQGKLVGQSTKWVIGQHHASLEPKGETTFNFVVTSSQPFTTTNLTAKVTFSQIILSGGKPADVRQSVVVTTR